MRTHPLARAHHLVILAAPLALAACPATPGRTNPHDDAMAPAAPATAPPAPQAAPRDPLVPELVVYATAPGELRGYLYRPDGPGPFPAIVFNHGSEQDAGNKRGQAEFYVDQGFVLFVPHRRGQGLSAAAGDYIAAAWDRTGQDPAKLVELLDAQVDDVAAAVDYVRHLPYVDGDRVALVGCSFGGIETLLAAERDLHIRAAVDFAGGAIVWARTPPLQERMKRAARAATVPVFFLQAENDFDTAPSRVLSDEMKRAGRPARVHIFPSNGTTAMDGHGFCMGGPHPAWGAEVLDFLHESMGDAASR
jgi:dipeptidyl aminopeptidase/acylaminoacyl peptidase